MAGTWETMEDFERDLLLLAEFSVLTPKQMQDNDSLQVPDTIVQYKRKMAMNRASVLHSDIDDSATYVISGRGRGVSDRLLRPGEGVAANRMDDIELRKKIRQVSGLGYSNDLIERSIRAQSYNLKQSDDSSLSNFKLRETSLSKGTTSTSSSDSTGQGTQGKVSRKEP